MTTPPTLYDRFKRDRPAAHRLLFQHRHPDETPEFHNDIIKLWNNPRVLQSYVEAFRGAAKSTLAEEHLTLAACMEDWPYALVLGESYERACERLESVKHEIEYNELLAELCGDQRGSVWTEDVIVLANGVKLQAFGRGQSLRGAKHHEARPMFILGDDLEDEDAVASEEARRKVMRWLRGVVLPAMDPKGRISIMGTPLHPKAMMARLPELKDWKGVIIPIRHTDPKTGEVTSSWPARFSLDWITAKEAEYAEDGNSTEFAQEYLCQAEDVTVKLFQPNYIKVIPQPIVHSPKMVFVDPNRGGTKGGSKLSRAGYVVWSWAGNKLVVHDSLGAYHQPDEMLDTIFRLDDEHKPAWIGVEWNGLEAFIGQPLNTEMVKRGKVLPIRPERAPKDKDGFIGAMQHFYKNGLVEHVGHQPDLVAELLAFPSGRKDIINALAYAYKLKAGQPVYTDFSHRNIEDGLEADHRGGLTLCMSARGGLTVGVLAQAMKGTIHVLADWVLREPPAKAVAEIATNARFLAGGARYTVMAPPEQWERYTGFGLPAALQRFHIAASQGCAAANREMVLRRYLRQEIEGLPALLVAPEARWTVNGLYVGYARRYNAAGHLEDTPEDNEYRVVIEALESYAAWIDLGAGDGDGDDGAQARFAYTQDGRRFRTSAPR